MITPETQKLIDELKLENQKLKDENNELKRQIEEARTAAEKLGEDDIFEGIFN